MINASLDCEQQKGSQNLKTDFSALLRYAYFLQTIHLSASGFNHAVVISTKPLLYDGAQSLLQRGWQDDAGRLQAPLLQLDLL